MVIFIYLLYRVAAPSNKPLQRTGSAGHRAPGALGGGDLPPDFTTA